MGSIGSRANQVVDPGPPRPGRELQQLLSPEEVAALLQGLQEGEARPQAGSGPWRQEAGAALPVGVGWRWPAFNLKRLSLWVSSFTELRWPQF